MLIALAVVVPDGFLVALGVNHAAKGNLVGKYIVMGGIPLALVGGIAIVIARRASHERFKAMVVGVWSASIAAVLMTGLMVWRVWFPLLFGARITVGAVISMEGIPLLEVPVIGIMYTVGYLVGRVRSA